MPDEPAPMVSITYEVPLPVLRKFQRWHDRDRQRYERWLDNNHDDDGNSFVGGAAKLAALDVALPPEMPEVGRRIRFGRYPTLSVTVEAVALAHSETWIWGRQSTGQPPITYRLSEEWTYVA